MDAMPEPVIEKSGVAQAECFDNIPSLKTEIPHVDVRVRHKKSREEKRLVRKQDMLILPLLSGSLFFGYLDRGQIGNARVMGMQVDLRLTSQQFYNCVMMFFLGYMVLELPAGLLLRICPPRFVLGVNAVLFGIFACAMASAKSYASVMVLRVLIGFAEAFVNNAYLYISLWYRPNELSTRTAAIYGMSPVAGAISGIISWGLEKHVDKVLGFDSWQWLFIIEGAITIFWGLIVIALLPGLPDTVIQKGNFFFRHEDERKMISARMVASQNTEGSRARYHQILIALKDPKMYLGSAIIGAQGIGIGAFSVFLPTFIKEFGFSALDTQLYSMIPYAFGLLTLITVPYTSDRLNRKFPILLGCLCTSITGFVILLSTTNKVALVAGACFVLAGAYPGLAISVAWSFTFHGGYTKRVTTTWASQIFIQCESIIATQVYDHPPRFFKGHGVALGFYILAAICTVIVYFMLSRANADRDRRAEELVQSGQIDDSADKTFEDLCDFHPRWRYAL
ncbi:major facilitator superfamily domain-containing protein [Exophiala viscosa]|uniref:Major facilitator superfamily domain-containing protein n=1 Tax=Exophiala viscosa TaxID=2486360 RepID=A0AAN6DYV9_9EURO|nr:major facilitator superfamily domain-containing protein [Exophiala viscosa]